MKKLILDLGDRSYPIIISSEAWQNEHLTGLVKGRKVLILSNETVAPLYLEKLKKSLPNSDIDELILPDGERYKNIATLESIYNKLLEGNYDRSSIIIALGGGVIGDTAGFAAATYQRGIDFIQRPTTLLSQVDSSVGGKTAVNHPLGKKMIGAFYQPKGVFIDLTTLKTLPDREYSAGMAEVIKYGLIRDANFFDWLELNIEAIMARDTDCLAQAILVSCKTKADVVSSDETEQGVRAILNLGHTFGHAIESAQEYKDWLHGEAVGAGMAMAARMSRNLGWIDDKAVERIEKLLLAANLPIQAPDNIPAKKMRDLMSYDKKVERGQLRLILLKAIGNAVIFSDFDEDELLNVLEQG